MLRKFRDDIVLRLGALSRGKGVEFGGTRRSRGERWIHLASDK